MTLPSMTLFPDDAHPIMDPAIRVVASIGARFENLIRCILEYRVPCMMFTVLSNVEGIVCGARQLLIHKPLCLAERLACVFYLIG